MQEKKDVDRKVVYLIAGGFAVLLMVLSLMDADIATQVQGQSIRGLGNFVLRTEVDGFIQRIHVKEGEPCDAGSLIFSLNAKEIEAELFSVQADMDGAQMQVNSLRESEKVQQQELDAVSVMVQKGLEPAKELRRAQMDMNHLQNSIVELSAKLLSLQAQKEKVQTRLMKYRIVGPMDGVLTRIHKFNAGDVVKSGDMLAEISPQEGDISFEAKISPSDISMVQIGNKARVTLTAFNRYEVKPLLGAVTYVSSSSMLDSEGKSYFLARVTPDAGQLNVLDKKNVINVGMTAEISIRSGTRSVLAFILSPLMRGSSNVFTQR
jgi:multidrug efflux pump subunit AcrA (membrane-fusion protein)